jgi:solute carrier family 25 uncoupling protein 8/9
MPSPRADGTAPWVTPWQREWLSASLGCAVADTIFNPLEVLKVRRQVAMGSAGASVSAVPASTIALARAAIKDKGVYRGLWHPGLEATIYRAFSYTGFRIGMYPAVRDAVVETRFFGDSNSIAARVVAGAGTGAIGSALFNPIDVVRIRMQGPTPYKSTASAFIEIARRDGVAGLWRGWGVCMTRAATLSGSQLATYDTVKKKLRSDSSESFFREGPILHFTASLCSGVVAQTVTQPADTLKTLVMAQSGSRRENALAAFFSLLKKSGPSALYRGFWPAAARQGPVMVIQMPIVEQFRKAMGLEYF